MRIDKRKKILGIIPARGGSKGVPCKNIRVVAGKPLIAWTIKEAKKSEHIEQLIVSSEDDEIIAVAKEFGCEAPFVRPMELAQDETPGIEPIKHAINFYLNNGVYFDYIICLQCTSPLRTVSDIDGAIELCLKSNADSVVSVCEAEHSPYWMKKVDERGCIANFIDDGMKYARRQDLPKVYRINGAFYMATPELIMKTNNWYSKETRAFIMDNMHSIDIDSELDFIVVETVLKQKGYEYIEYGR